MAAPPSPFVKVQYFDNNGLVAAGYKLFTYAAGTSNKQNTFQDSGLATPNTNPIILDSSGRANIFLTPGSSYKYVMATPTDTDPPLSPIWSVDNVQAAGNTSGSATTNGTFVPSVTAGQPVYLSDGSGGRVAGSWYLGDATNAYSSSAAPVIGIVTQTTGAGQSGPITLIGEVTGLSGLVAGTTYYISGAPGNLTSTAPANARQILVADSMTSGVVAFAMPQVVSATTLNLTGNATIGGTETVTGLATLNGGAQIAATPTFEPGTTAGSQYCFFQITIAPGGIPASVAANTTANANLTGITGLLATDLLVSIQKAATQAGLFISPADLALGGVTGAGTATVKYVNVSTGAIVPTAAESYVFTVVRPAATGTAQLIAVQVTASPTGIPASVAANVTANSALTAITGVLSGDILIGVQKAGAQTGLWIKPADLAQGGVTGAAAATLCYVNVTTGSITPTAAESYVFTVLRSATLGQQALTPTIVSVNPVGISGNVVAETTGTMSVTSVFGLLSTDILLWVQKAVTQAGLFALFADQIQGGVTGPAALTYRYANVTVGALTPSAIEALTLVVLRATASALPLAPANGFLTADVSAAGIIGTTSTLETPLWIYNLPANILNGVGKGLRITANFAHSGAATQNKTSRLYFGATQIGGTVSTSAANFDSVIIYAYVFFLTSTTQFSFGSGVAGVNNTTINNNTLNITWVASPTETLTGSVVLKATGQVAGASTDTVTLNSVVVETLGA